MKLNLKSLLVAALMAGFLGGTTVYAADPAPADGAKVEMTDKAAPADQKQAAPAPTEQKQAAPAPAKAKKPAAKHKKAMHKKKAHKKAKHHKKVKHVAKKHKKAAKAKKAA